ncbi:MAG TPA: hypothetical protein PLF25_00440, partial [Accumulibacter sp.]|nr:hypothetical protein [Accumulibacter sp.]
MACGSRIGAWLISGRIRLGSTDFGCLSLYFAASGGLPEIILSKALRSSAGSAFRSWVLLFCGAKQAASRQEKDAVEEIGLAETFCTAQSFYSSAVHLLHPLQV